MKRDRGSGKQASGMCKRVELENVQERFYLCWDALEAPGFAAPQENCRAPCSPPPRPPAQWPPCAPHASAAQVLAPMLQP